jgi:toxin CcdB
MPRFDVYPGRGRALFLLDVQSNHLDVLPTRTVVPLEPGSGGTLPGFRDLTPRLDVAGTPVVMVTPLLAAVPRRLLGKPVANLLDQSDDIIRALDILLTGF